MKSFYSNKILIGALTVLCMLFLIVSCSDDDDCPVCPPDQTEWVMYDDFTDNTLDADLWNYIADCCGGQVLESANQLQVWGNTISWTGTGIVRTTHPKLAWRFDIAEAYSEDTPNGCQGWHIYAYNPIDNIYIEVLNDVNSGCATQLPLVGDAVGTYQIVKEDDSLVVYKDGTLVHRVFENNMEFFSLHITSDNVYGDGTHSHLFIDNVYALEWKP